MRCGMTQTLKKQLKRRSTALNHTFGHMKSDGKLRRKLSQRIPWSVLECGIMCAWSQLKG